MNTTNTPRVNAPQTPAVSLVTLATGEQFVRAAEQAKRDPWPPDVRAAVVRAIRDALVADYRQRSRASMVGSPTGIHHTHAAHKEPAA